MIKISRMTIVTVAMILCLSGMVMTSEAQAQRFVDNGRGSDGHTDGLDVDQGCDTVRLRTMELDLV